MKTINLATWNRNTPLMWEQNFDQPTKIFVNGRRVTESTEIITSSGRVEAVDLCDDHERIT